MAEIAVLTLHGMGRQSPEYACDLLKELEDRLGENFGKISFIPAYYQDILQDNEDTVWRNLNAKVRWNDLREFVLFGFGDAAGLENGKEQKDSVYKQAQIRIAQALLKAHQETENGPAIFIAHSLGCHVLSCYLWDARNAENSLGIWPKVQNYAAEITENGPPLSDEQITYLKGDNLQSLFTTGCNIPIFVAAHARKDILPFTLPDDCEWHNYYDPDDVLGWPLVPLSDEYKIAVKDHKINAGGNLFDWILKSWNPMSHELYWGDDDVLDHLESEIRKLI